MKKGRMMKEVASTVPIYKKKERQSQKMVEGNDVTIFVQDED